MTKPRKEPDLSCIIALCNEPTLPAPCTFGSSATSSEISTCDESTEYTGLRFSRYSPVIRVLPSAKVNVPVRTWILLAPSVTPVLLYDNPMDTIPKSTNCFNSPAEAIPSPSESCQIRSSVYIASLLSILPSLLLSYSANAVKPLDANVLLSFINVRSPNNSLPPLIIPSPFLSYASKPSLAPTHEVFSAKPLLSKSKKAFDSSSETVVIPSPSKSNTNGSIRRFCSAWAFCISTYDFINSPDARRRSYFWTIYLA